MDFNKGENHPNYRHDLTEEERKELELARRDGRQLKWARIVKMRDNYICQCCGIKKSNKVKIEAHHIDNFHDDIQGRYDVTNGITLCLICHKEFHRRYGNRNTNVEQIYEFMTDIREREFFVE